MCYAGLLLHATKNKILIHYHISLLASFVGNNLGVSNRFKRVDFCPHILWHRVNFTFFWDFPIDISHVFSFVLLVILVHLKRAVS